MRALHHLVEGKLHCAEGVPLPEHTEHTARVIDNTLLRSLQVSQARSQERDWDDEELHEQIVKQVQPIGRVLNGDIASPIIWHWENGCCLAVITFCLASGD